MYVVKYFGINYQRIKTYKVDLIYRIVRIGLRINELSIAQYAFMQRSYRIDDMNLDG